MDKETTSLLNELIETSRDGQNGFAILFTAVSCNTVSSRIWRNTYGIAAFRPHRQGRHRHRR